MTKKSVRPLCGCNEPAVVLFPVHEDNSMTSGNEIASEEPAWTWAALCEEDAQRASSLNPDNAPKPIKLPAKIEVKEEEEEEEADS